MDSDLYWVRQLTPQLSDGRPRDPYLAFGKYGQIVISNKPTEPINIKQAMRVRNAAQKKGGKGVYIEKACQTK